MFTPKKPPLGLTPRFIYEEKRDVERFNNICDAISRYYSEGLKLPIEWIEEYNDLLEKIGTKYKK